MQKLSVHKISFARSLFFFALFFVWASQSVFAQKPTPDEIFRQNLLQASAKMYGLVGYSTVAVSDTRPATDVMDSLSEQSAIASKVTHGSLLMQGVRAVQFEKDHAIVPTYVKNRLKRGVQFSLEDVAYLRSEKKADFLLQSRLQQNKNLYTLVWELYDLKAQRAVFQISFPKIKGEEVFKTAATWEFLPEANVGLLEFAASNVGQQIGRGECWDLPATWLKEHGYVVKGYNFGTEVSIEEALPGDVLTNDENGNHHVMLLVKPEKDLNGAKIYHQNTSGRRFVVADTFPNKMREGIKVWRPNVKK